MDEIIMESMENTMKETMENTMMVIETMENGTTKGTCQSFRDMFSGFYK
jgi:hypothetical protein